MKLETMHGEIAFTKNFSIAALAPEDTDLPHYQIGSRVALDNGCQPESWNTGIVVGLHLLVYHRSKPYWMYCIHLDSPIGSQEWYEQKHLAYESNIPSLQEALQKPVEELRKTLDGL
jgi:hypothetical protein